VIAEVTFLNALDAEPLIVALYVGRRGVGRDHSPEFLASLLPIVQIGCQLAELKVN
jgi:hypothetical protein